MDIPWGSDKAKKFVTNVGLITSNGPKGPNVMAAEWTHHISYSPGMIAVSINNGNDVTAANIEKSGQFGVNIAADDQNVAASIAGGNSGKNVDKIAILKEIGVEFYKAKKIDAPMIKGAALNVECKLVRSERLGSHTMFIGEAVEASEEQKNPLVFSGGRYWKLAERIEKPLDAVLKRIEKLAEKHTRR